MEILHLIQTIRHLTHLQIVQWTNFSNVIQATRKKPIHFIIAVLILVLSGFSLEFMWRIPFYLWKPIKYRDEKRCFFWADTVDILWIKTKCTIYKLKAISISCKPTSSSNRINNQMLHISLKFAKLAIFSPTQQKYTT